MTYDLPRMADGFATVDPLEAHLNAIRIWRAAGGTHTCTPACSPFRAARA